MYIQETKENPVFLNISKTLMKFLALLLAKEELTDKYHTVKTKKIDLWELISGSAYWTT